MPTDDLVVPSPTKEIAGDASGKKSGNLSTGQAATQLFLSAEKEAKQQPTRQATEETAPLSAEPAAPKPIFDPPVAEAVPTAELPATEETPAVETTEPAETPEVADDTVPSQTTQFTPEQQQIFNRRLGKEVAKTKAIETQLKEAATQLADLEAKFKAQPETTVGPVPVVVIGDQPLSEVQDMSALTQLNQQAKEAVRFVEATLDNPSAWKTQVFTDPESQQETRVRVTMIGDKAYTEADLRASARRAKITMEDHVPVRAQFLQARNAAQQQAFTDFPFLADKTSSEYQQVQSAKRNPANAAILAMPNADYLFGMLVEGNNARQARVDAAKAKAVVAPIKLKQAKPSNDQAVVSSSGAPIRQPSGTTERQQLAQERARLSKKGGISSVDAATYLKQSELIRNSR